MKALAFPWFVVKVRPLCTRGSLKAVEAGKPDRAVRYDGSRLLSCLLEWQNYGSFPNLGRGPGREAAVEDF